MTTIELPAPADVGWQDTAGVDDFVAHLYQWRNGRMDGTCCGISKTKDKHNSLHHAVPWPGLGSDCPICGAKVCPECEQAAVGK